MEDYFKELFKEDRLIRPEVDGLQLPRLREDQTEWLERSFEEDEVKKAVWLLDENKALGLDGFTLAFYKSC